GLPDGAGQRLMFSPSVTQSDALAALRSFLLGILPAGNALFTGSISGTSLTVAKLQSGTINIGDQVLGQGVAWGTTIIAGSGSSFTVNTSQTVDSTQMAT